jgi:BirA family biotin operon repressor/biotin-[acetyl-CoA-carboxylase] ligase
VAHQSIIVFNYQQTGKGRYGKSFFSQKGTGIYMSLVLRPQKTVEDILLFTIYAAVAVVKTIELLSNKQPKIKWINDILIDNKKVILDMSKIPILACVSKDETDIDMSFDTLFSYSFD